MYLKTLHTTWLWFNTKFLNVPNHRMTSRNLLDTFYRALRSSTKPITDTISGEEFMCLHWDQVFEILNQITKTNQGWHTQDMDIPIRTYTIRSPTEKKISNEMVAREAA